MVLVMDPSQPKERRHVWTNDENDRLTRAVMELGEHDWANVSVSVAIDRNACRVHWTEALAKLNRSKQWTDDEERQLVWLVEEKKAESIPWTYIARTLGTLRTPKQCQYKFGAITKRNKEFGSEPIVEKVIYKKILLKPVIPEVEDRHSDHSDGLEPGSYSLFGIW
jgi:hypothetical protein